MASTTVVEIIERAQAAADMHDDFVTSTQWLRWLNVENRALTMFVARTGYVPKYSTQTITATGAASYTIDEPVAILAVFELDDGNYRRLKDSDVVDGAGHMNTSTTGPARYFNVVQGADVSGVGKLEISLWPRPESGTYKVMTINMPATLAIGDSVSYSPGFEERLVLGLARRALDKEESSSSAIIRQIGETERYIEEFCWDRIMAGHQQVRNVDRVERGWYPYPQIPTRDSWRWVV